MKHLFLLAAVLFSLALAPSAGATTYISACPTAPISTPGYYVLTTNLVNTSTGPCLELSGNTSTSSAAYVFVECGGYNITATATSGVAVSIHDNAGPTELEACNIIAPINRNKGIEINRSGTGGPSIRSFLNGNTYTGGDIQIFNSPYWQSNRDVATNVYFNVDASDNFLAQFDTVDNSSGVISTTPGGFYIVDSNNTGISSTTILANGLGGGSGGTDDGIVTTCSPVLWPCAGPSFYNNTIKDVYDAGIELLGHFSVGYIRNNTVLRPQIAGIGCYGAYNCSLDTFIIDNNSVTATGSGTALMSITGDGSSTGFLTNNTISNNTITIGSATSIANSYVGYPVAWWVGSSFHTVSNNTLTNNTFGRVILYMQDVLNYIDGGTNMCFMDYPGGSPVVCH